MEPEINMDELVELSEEMLDMVTTRWPKENKRFIRKEARSALKIAKETARSRLKNLRPASVKSSYMSGMKVGKPYYYLEDPTDLSIRAYNSSPHGHLIEHGHVVKPRGSTSGKTAGYNTSGRRANKNYTGDSRTGSKERFVKGFNIMGDTNDKYQSIFYRNVDAHVDDLIDKGLF